MYWKSLAEFLAMGTHGSYVWGSFAVMALAMALEPLLVWRGRISLIARLRRQYRAARMDRASRAGLDTAPEQPPEQDHS